MRQERSVSVVMATFNGEAYLDKQIRTILGQSSPPIELIIADDGSKDQTVQIARRFSSNGVVDIRIVENPTRLGFADNFLAAAGMASGRYVAFCDQDDVWLEHKLSTMKSRLDRDGSLLATHRFKHLDTYERVGRKTIGLETGRATLLERLSADPWGNFLGFTMLFDRRLLEVIPRQQRGLDPYKEGQPLAHDRWLYFLATSLGRTSIIKEPLAYYRQHASQTFGANNRRGVRQRFTTKVRYGGAQSAYLGMVADHRSKLFEVLDKCDWLDDSAFPEAAAYWAEMASALRVGSSIYGEPDRSKRLALFRDLLSNGSYRSSTSGGLGKERMIEHLLVPEISLLLNRHFGNRTSRQ